MSAWLIESEAGSTPILPFLFISFGNHRFSKHPAIEDKQVREITEACTWQNFILRRLSIC
jgi:hypothetical protein